MGRLLICLLILMMCGCGILDYGCTLWVQDPTSAGIEYGLKIAHSSETVQAWDEESAEEICEEEGNSYREAGKTIDGYSISYCTCSK